MIFTATEYLLFSDYIPFVTKTTISKKKRIMKWANITNLLRLVALRNISI